MSVTLETHEVPYLISGAIALVCVVVELMYLLTPQRRRAKKPLRAFETIVMSFFVILDALIILDVNLEIVGIDWIINLGVAMLSILLACEVIEDWRRKPDE